MDPGGSRALLFPFLDVAASGRLMLRGKLSLPPDQAQGNRIGRPCSKILALEQHIIDLVFPNLFPSYRCGMSRKGPFSGQAPSAGERTLWKFEAN
jgi:hypothetical protein